MRLFLCAAAIALLASLAAPAQAADTCVSGTWAPTVSGQNWVARAVVMKVGPGWVDYRAGTKKAPAVLSSGRRYSLSGLSFETGKADVTLSLAGGNVVSATWREKVHYSRGFPEEYKLTGIHPCSGTELALLGSSGSSTE